MLKELFVFKKREFFKENDVVSLCCISFCKDGSFANDMSACFFSKGLHGFHGSACADDIIKKEDVFAVEHFHIRVHEVKALLALRRDGFIFHQIGFCIYALTDFLATM